MLTGIRPSKSQDCDKTSVLDFNKYLYHVCNHTINNNFHN